jgi:hypothetical protein
MVERSIETDVDSCPPPPHTTPEVLEDGKLDTVPEVTEEQQVEVAVVPIVPIVPKVEPIVPKVEPIVPVVPEVVPTPPSHAPSRTPSKVTADILVQVTEQLKSFLAGGKLTLSNITGVVIDLYNFIESYKSLTHSQKVRMLVNVLTDFVRREVDGDQTLLLVIDTLVPHVIETIVGVSDGTINIGEIIEEAEKKSKGCLSCLTGLFKKQ